MPQIRAVSVSDQVLEQIRSDILSQRLVPGSPYTVKELAEQFGVSRTPVREALARLSELGMVRFDRSRGFRVVETSIRDIEEIFQLRLQLEVPAAHRAACMANHSRSSLVAALDQRLVLMAASAGDKESFMTYDTQFHELILEAAGNRRSTRIVANLRAMMNTRGTFTDRDLETILAEHRPVRDSIEKGEAETAAEAMYKHVRGTGELLLNALARGAGACAPRIPWFDDMGFSIRSASAP